MTYKRLDILALSVYSSSSLEFYQSSNHLAGCHLQRRRVGPVVLTRLPRLYHLPRNDDVNKVRG